jgi:uncharacterized membrane protein YecN with MAPEG domain
MLICARCSLLARWLPALDAGGAWLVWLVGIVACCCKCMLAQGSSQRGSSYQ